MHVNTTIQGQGMFEGEPVSILDSHKELLLVISSHNPIKSEWVYYQFVTNTIWFIDSKSS